MTYLNTVVLCLGFGFGFIIGVECTETFYRESLAETKLEQCTIDKPAQAECKLYVTYKPISVTKYMLAK